MADMNTNTQTGAQTGTPAGNQTGTPEGNQTGTQAAAANTGANGNGTGGAQQQTGGENLSAFDKFLQTEGMQAEFDRRVQKALNTQQTKLNATIQQQINDAVTEAQKLAKMTADQKAEYERQKQAEDLSKREAAITRRELMATAKDTLAVKHLPIGLADIVNYESAETANASIDAIEKAFQTAVQAAVEEKLKGGRAPEKAQGGNTSIEDAIKAAMRTGFFGA